MDNVPLPFEDGPDDVCWDDDCEACLPQDA